MDVVADVLAGAETIYAASKRSKDEGEQASWANSRQSYSEATATPNKENAGDGDEPIKEDFEPRAEVIQAVPVDIEEHAEGYTLYMDVPGLQKSDVKASSQLSFQIFSHAFTSSEMSESSRAFSHAPEQNISWNCGDRII